MINFPHRVLYALFFFLIAVGILMRAVETINQNYIFGFDHGREYLMVRDIVDNRDFRLIGTPLGAGSAGIQGIFHGPAYYYLLAVPYILFNGDPYGGVVLMFLFGLGTIGISFILGRKLLGIRGGLLFASLVSLSPPLVAQSRFFWSPFPSTFFAIMAFYFISKITKGKLFVFLSAFFSAFVYHFEFAIAVPLILALPIYSFCVLKIRSVKHYLLLLLGFVVATLPAIVFEIRHNFMAVQGLLSYLTTPKDKKASLTFLQNQLDHFGSFVFNIADSFPNRELIPSLVLFVLMVLGLFILIRKEKNKEVKSFILYLLILPVVTFLSFVLLRNTVYQYYLFHLVLVYLLIFSYIMTASYKQKLKSVFKVFVFVLIMYVLTSLPLFLKTFLYDINDYGGDAKIKGKVDAIDYIYNDAKNKEFGLLVFSPPVYTYPYDYIMYWRGKEKYGYIPPAEKKKEFYLLIEVDPSKPWSYKGWLETVIRDGEVVKETELPSGIIIQKRLLK